MYQQHRISIAPMMNWTDCHCRMFYRQITRHTWLYTEMLPIKTLLYGNIKNYLISNKIEHPVALQLGGNCPVDLAQGAKLGEKWGYNEINLNCGCPSKHAIRGVFGACLMLNSNLVADCIKAMRDAVSINVTIKHRLGIDNIASYDAICDFVGKIAEAGCKTFFIHARNAVLSNFNPRKNRTIPALRYDIVYRLKRDFRNLEIVLNGGIKTLLEIDEHLKYVDGVMLGRGVYYNPFLLSDFDARYYSEFKNGIVNTSRYAVVMAMITYAHEQLKQVKNKNQTFCLNNISRHMLGLVYALPGARAFRRTLSDAKKIALNNPNLLLEALVNTQHYM